MENAGDDAFDNQDNSDDGEHSDRIPSVGEGDYAIQHGEAFNSRWLLERMYSTYDLGHNLHDRQDFVSIEQAAASEDIDEDDTIAPWVLNLRPVQYRPQSRIPTIDSDTDQGQNEDIMEQIPEINEEPIAAPREERNNPRRVFNLNGEGTSSLALHPPSPSPSEAGSLGSLGDFNLEPQLSLRIGRIARGGTARGGVVTGGSMLRPTTSRRRSDNRVKQRKRRNLFTNTYSLNLGTIRHTHWLI